jgi:hypothetical protein
MTEEEELNQLRKFKREHEANSLNRAFFRLEQLLDAPFQQRCDTVMSVRSLRIVGEALLELKRALDEK